MSKKTQEKKNEATEGLETTADTPEITEVSDSEPAGGSEQDAPAGLVVKTDAAEAIESIKQAVTTDLHGRLEKAVAAGVTSGHSEAVQSLQKVELLTGTLKFSLPAAIAGVTDEELKAGMQALLLLL